MMSGRKTRAEVPLEETWRLEDLFATHDDWERELSSIEAAIPSVARFRGRLAEGAGTLLACLEAGELLLTRMIRVGTYSYLRLAEDGTNPANQESAARVAALQAKAMAAASFIRPEILALPDGTVQRYMAEEAKLEGFRRMLERVLEDRPHVLGFEAEAALASLGEVLESPQMLYERAKSSDMLFEPAVDSKGQQVPVSFATYEVMLEPSDDTILRRNAYSSFSRGLARYQNVLGGTFGTEIKKNVVTARLRGFESATHMFLHEQELSIEVYNSLLDVIQKGLAPHMRRYVDLRRRALGLDKILYCDIEAPLDPGFAPKVSYEEGAKIIIEAVQVMGTEYAEIVTTALENRWVDFADNIGKSTGAFCAPIYDVHPYVLTTWGGDMGSVFTLAHELGHAVHMVMSARDQRILNTEVSRVFVEAPSTFNEILVARHVLRKSDDPRMRRWVTMQMLATYYHDFVRHMIEAELLRRVYDMAETGRPITAAALSAVQGEVLDEYWAGVVEIDDGAKLTWMRQPHYYMGLYPYTYSAGLTCATAVEKAVEEEGAAAAGRWVEVLKAGGTKKPIELMRMAGVNLEDVSVIRSAVDVVGNMVDEVEKGF